jgi:hypothetical protein
LEIIFCPFLKLELELIVIKNEFVRSSLRNPFSLFKWPVK